MKNYQLNLCFGFFPVSAYETRKSLFRLTINNQNNLSFYKLAKMRYLFMYMTHCVFYCRFCLGPSVNLRDIADLLPFGMTGADLYSLCADAYMIAISRLISQAEFQEENKGFLIF